MTASPSEPTTFNSGNTHDPGTDVPPPGQATLVLAALAVGLVLMSIQLWLLTVALELYLAGHGGQVWQLALASGLIFIGGLLVQWIIRRRPRLRRLPPYEARNLPRAEPGIGTDERAR